MSPWFPGQCCAGRCAACKAPISARYPFVELLAAGAAAWCAAHFGFGIAAFAAMAFLWSVIAASFIDFDTQLLPDSITLPLLWLGLLVNIPGTFVDLRSAVIGAAAGYLSLWGVYWLFKLATGKEGMGFGDFKLLAAVGAWCGWQALPVTIPAVVLYRGGGGHRPHGVCPAWPQRADPVRALPSALRGSSPCSGGRN